MEDSPTTKGILALFKTLLVLSGFSDDLLEKIFQEFAIGGAKNTTLPSNLANNTGFPINDVAYNEALSFGYVVIITPLFMLIRFGVGYRMLKQNISKAGSQDESRKKKIEKFAKNQADRVINDVLAPILGYGFAILGSYLGWLADSQTAEEALAVLLGVSPSVILEAITYVKTGLGSCLSKSIVSITSKLLGAEIPSGPEDDLPVVDNNNEVGSSEDLKKISYDNEEGFHKLSLQHP